MPSKEFWDWLKSPMIILPQKQVIENHYYIFVDNRKIEVTQREFEKHIGDKLFERKKIGGYLE